MKTTSYVPFERYWLRCSHKILWLTRNLIEAGPPRRIETVGAADGVRHIAQRNTTEAH